MSGRCMIFSSDRVRVLSAPMWNYLSIEKTSITKTQMRPNHERTDQNTPLLLFGEIDAQFDHANLNRHGSCRCNAYIRMQSSTSQHHYQHRVETQIELGLTVLAVLIFFPHFYIGSNISRSIDPIMWRAFRQDRLTIGMEPRPETFGDRLLFFGLGAREGFTD